jgi:hypothetical protein
VVPSLDARGEPALALPSAEISRADGARSAAPPARARKLRRLRGGREAMGKRKSEEGKFSRLTAAVKGGTR